MRANGSPSITRSVLSSASEVTVPTRSQGLGTSKDTDARDYFSNMRKHTIAFSTTQKGDRELIELAFSKSKADDRKDWLRQFKVLRLEHGCMPASQSSHSLELISTTTRMRSRSPTSSTRNSSFFRSRTTFVRSRPCVMVSSPVKGRSFGVVSRGSSRRKSK